MASTITTSLVLDTKNFNRNLNKVQQRLNVFKGLGTAMGRTMQYAVGGGLLVAGANALKAGVDFDLTLQKLKALAGPENARGVEKLAKTARLLGENSIYTASQVAEMQLSLKKLGLEVRTIDDMSESVLKFATAMDVDVNTAGTTVVNTMKKFTNSFKEFSTTQEKSAAISEQFVAATVNSALTFDTFRNSLNYAGAEANAAGFSFSETAAILGKLADAGFQGSRGGIILRKILQSVGKTSDDARKATVDLIKDQKTFQEVMKIVGVRAAGGTLAISGLTDEIDELAKKIEAAEGNVDAFSDAVQGSFYGRMREVISALEEVGIAFLDQFEKPIKRAISQLAEFIRSIDAKDVRKFGEAIKLIGEIIIASNIIRLFGGLLRTGKTLFGLFGDFAKTRTGLKVAGEFKLIGKAIKGLGGPVLAALTFMSAGIGDFMDKLERVRQFDKDFALANAGAASTIAGQAQAFEELKKLAPEEIYDRIRKGAIEAQLAFENGTSPARADRIAEQFVPKEVFDQIIEKANSMTGVFGETFETALPKAIAAYLPKAKKVKKSLGDIKDEVPTLTDLEPLKRIGVDTKQIAGVQVMAKELEKHSRAVIDNAENIAKAEETKRLAGVSDPISLNSEVMQQVDFLQLAADAAVLEVQANQLTSAFMGFGNVLGSAFQQAATGARTFGDALKTNLIAAISAVISKLIALSAAYGLAALAKAFLDGGKSLGQAASAITSSGFGSFLQGGFGFGGFAETTSNIRTTGYVAGSDLVLTTGRGLNVNDRLYG